MTSLTQEVCKEAGVKPRDAERSKNFFALGLVSWLFTRPIEGTLAWIEEKFKKNELVAEANRRAFRAGFDFGETAELFHVRYEVTPAPFKGGEYVNITGNTALACRCSLGATRSRRPRTSSTSSRSARSSVSAPSRQKMRSPASVRRSALPMVARSA